jgi:hypothetical protein
MELLMRLQVEAGEAGGRVIALLGNHETMNLLNIFRDVGPEAFADFATESSEKRRAKAYKEFEKFYTRLARESGQPIALGKEAKEWWMDLHPLGFLEYAEALSADGLFGRWLRTLPVAVVIDGTLFIHGGYGPLLKGTTIDELNARIAEEITLYDRLRAEMLADRLILEWHAVMEMKREVEREMAAIAEGGEKLAKKKPERIERARRLEAVLGWEEWWLVHEDGPVWFRGAAFWDEAERGPEMNELLDGVGVRRMVVGHTVQQTARITQRFDGRVILIDTGMLKGTYDGRPSALEIIGDSVTAVYENQRRPLPFQSREKQPG